jgi:hypothetical protein
MGATLQEIETAYGPVSVKDATPREGVPGIGLYYKPSNMTMHLQNGHLSDLAIFAPATGQPDAGKK